MTTVLPHNLLQTNPCIRHNFSTQVWPPWPPKEAREARKCSAAQGPHSEVVPRAFWRLVSKSCDECKGPFARGCEAKRWSHWTCSSLGTIFQPMRINSVPDVKCFCNNKNLLRAQSMVWHFVRHPVYIYIYVKGNNTQFIIHKPVFKPTFHFVLHVSALLLAIKECHM